MTEQEIEQLIEFESHRSRQAIDHIRRLSVGHNADLAEWCGRRLRHRQHLRGVAAFCFLALFAVGTNKAYADSRPQPHTIQYVLGDFSTEKATQSLTQLMQNL